MPSRSLSPSSARGRQAEARRNDLAVLEAARDVFTALGADAPVAAVAERAGVGMGTLYRRYGSKAELLQHLCVLAMEQALQAAGEALQADDPWVGLAGYITACIELRSGALASLAGQIETTAEMRRTARRGMARMAEIIARAHRNGSLRPDATAMDITWLIEQFSRRAPAPVDPGEERNVRSRLVAIALDGLRARTADRPGQILPGAPPSPARYVNRWSPAANRELERMERDRTRRNESHNLVMGLPAPLRIFYRLTSGNRQPQRPATAELTATSFCSCRRR